VKGGGGTESIRTTDKKLKIWIRVYLYLGFTEFTAGCSDSEGRKEEQWKVTNYLSTSICIIKVGLSMSNGKKKKMNSEADHRRFVFQGGKGRGIYRNTKNYLTPLDQVDFQRVTVLSKYAEAFPQTSGRLGGRIQRNGSNSHALGYGSIKKLA